MDTFPLEKMMVTLTPVAALIPMPNFVGVVLRNDTRMLGSRNPTRRVFLTSITYQQPRLVLYP
ncbi:hypothetical protein ACN23B_00015 [Anabaena sp. FACHB-709]|uniref:Uncharacterized protein n=2 Tax=Nostocaceae TaxID=1162 RepID=A0A1Z4KPQ3_ANAVA|nr:MULTISPECIES: hypothetical protein [Nostocaceae]BAY70972.1 hypothetical protein NIES23_37840 [Trichormus variabilis NIES-23]HBW30827.1 hypothetical protein [Nostoc sp. UBA8866]MBD2171369.1 hypothetical protein [Anabaena cylindrica FACHB-318]MBD2262961.1 hypothetical protein [Anabaena sp. FACHB-709]MBD2272697.1 hypothetical protein [Nostoc sp. PCC 7120 = FACHB-418]